MDIRIARKIGHVFIGTRRCDTPISYVEEAYWVLKMSLGKYWEADRTLSRIMLEELELVARAEIDDQEKSLIHLMEADHA